MVDAVELAIIDADERRNVPVVIISINGCWKVCHVRSRMPAFREDVNQFVTKDDAIEFAEDHDCVILD